MDYVNLMNTDLRLSAVCLGCASFGDRLNEEESFRILDGFYEAGGNFLDTANVYGKWCADKQNHSEQVIGKWLKARNAYGKMVVATKGAHYDLGAPEISRVNRLEIARDIEESLNTLGLEKISFYWLHRDDESKPVEEIIDMMEEFRRDGKIRYYGASNYGLPRLKRAFCYALERGVQGFSAVSNQWSLAWPNPGKNTNNDPTLRTMTDDLLTWHKLTATPAIPFSASASGFFEKLAAGKLPDNLKEVYMNERNTRTYKELCRRKEETRQTLYTLSLKALREQGFQTIPISSVRNLEQLAGLVAAGE